MYRTLKSAVTCRNEWTATSSGSNLFVKSTDAVAEELEKRLRADLREMGDFRRVHPLPQSGQDVPDDLDARLRHVAAQRGITVSELARQAIEMFLDVPNGRRRLHAAGAGASSRSEISEPIEEILADEFQPPS